MEILRHMQSLFYSHKEVTLPSLYSIHHIAPEHFFHPMGVIFLVFCSCLLHKVSVNGGLTRVLSSHTWSDYSAPLMRWQSHLKSALVLRQPAVSVPDSFSRVWSIWVFHSCHPRLTTISRSCVREHFSVLDRSPEYPLVH